MIDEHKSLLEHQLAAFEASGSATSPTELRAAVGAMQAADVPAIWQALSIEAYRRRALETWVMMIEGSKQASPWRDLATDPPLPSSRAVLLFPQITECGHPFMVSNTDYARKNALKDGYTHWMDIPLVPGNLEEIIDERLRSNQR